MTKGFSIEKLRELNKIKVFAGSNKPGEKPSNSPIFEAYISGGFDLDFKVNVGSGLGSVFKDVKPVWGLLTKSLFNVPLQGGIDISEKLLYSGSEPISLGIKCFLVVGDGGFDEDIKKPINNLLQYFLPTRGNQTINKDIESILDAAYQRSVEKHEKKGKEVPQTQWNLVNEGFDTLSSWIGPAYYLKYPKNLNNNSYLAVKLGPITIREVYIESVKIHIPQLVYSGGYPDHITMDLGIRSLRTTTYDYVKGFLK